MIRVLHFAPGFRYGGIESLLMGLHRQLDHEHFQFDLITDNREDQSEFEVIRESGGYVHQFSGFKQNPAAYLARFARVLNRYDRRNTVFHVHDPVRGMPVLGIAKRMGFINRVVHSHNDSLDGTRFPLLSSVIARASNAFANRHLACSRNAGRFLFGDIPFGVFKNAIDIAAYAFDPVKRARIRSQLNLKENDRVVGHTGRFSDQKNHELIARVFLDLCKSRSDIILLLVGEGEYKPRIRALFEQAGVLHRTRFVGRQSDIVGYLSACDVFFMPSHFEGLGISLIEAQACGLPCLVSDVFPEEAFVTRSVVSLNLSQSVSVWAQALSEMLGQARFDSPSAIDTLRTAGFDVRQEWKTLLKFYGYNV